MIPRIGLARLALAIALVVSCGCACRDRPRLFDRFRMNSDLECCPTPCADCCTPAPTFGPILEPDCPTCDTGEGPFMGIPIEPGAPPGLLPMPGQIPPAGVQEGTQPAQPFPAEANGVKSRPLGRAVKDGGSDKDG